MNTAQMLDMEIRFLMASCGPGKYIKFITAGGGDPAKEYCEKTR